MRKFFCCFLMLFVSFGLIINEASAKRFGGGRSFGIQRSHSSLFSNHQAPSAKKTNFAQQKPRANRFGGLLGGLIIGGLLTSLFMGHGIGAGLISWLLLGSLVFFIAQFLKRKMAFNTSAANSNFSNQFTNKQEQNSSLSQFSTESFLREAKVKFIRLQQAYDKKNLYDLAQLTTAEVYAEIKMQLDEMGDEPNNTEVINLKVELINMSKQVDATLATVRFTGLISENTAPATEIDEIWHFSQFVGNKHWLVSGVQQDVMNFD
ncbi:MAG: 39S ribosomal protein L45 [Proteobacteria bacterium]|nr:39S ribosomal protein L45 [Pseudomonadota bacterium]